MNNKSILSTNKYRSNNKLIVFFLILSLFTIIIVNLVINNSILKYIVILFIIIFMIYIFIKTKILNSVKIFLKEIKNEFKKITWSNKKEIQQSTMVVITVIICTSIVLWIIDSILTFILSKTI